MFSHAIAQQQLPSLPSRPSCTAKLLSSSSFVVPSRNDSYNKQLQPSNPSCPSGDAAPALHFSSFPSQDTASTVAFVGPSRDALQHYILPCIIIRMQPLPRILLFFLAHDAVAHASSSRPHLLHQAFWYFLHLQAHADGHFISALRWRAIVIHHRADGRSSIIIVPTGDVQSSRRRAIIHPRANGR